jgi:hypothetical protein
LCRRVSDSVPLYALAEDELQELTNSLLIARPPQGTTRRFVCYRVDSGCRYANIGRHLEREVFETKFGNTTDVMAAEYGPYDAPGRSIFFISVDRHEKTAAGVARMIHNSESGLKTLNDLVSETGPLRGRLDVASFQAYHGIADLDTCWDHATLAVRDRYRHGGSYAGLSVQLHRASYVSALLGIEHVVSILDSRALVQIRDYLGVPFSPLNGTGTFSYLGSTHSQAVHGYYPEFYRRMTGWQQYKPKRLLARHAFRQLVHGSEDDALVFASAVSSRKTD